MSRFSLLNCSDLGDPALEKKEHSALSSDWSSVDVPMVNVNNIWPEKVSESSLNNEGWTTVGTKKAKKKNTYQPKQPISFIFVSGNSHKCHGYTVARGTPRALEHKGVWYLPHREDGPAYEYADGSFKRYRDGLVHSTEGPAIYWAKTKEYKYFTNGVLNRRDGPAIHTPLGEYYYQDGKLHREDGPAVVEPGKQEWYLNGVLQKTSHTQ